MNWTTRCAVVIPCRNEARNIAAVVAAVRAFLPTVIVVDDGSQDETAAMAEQAGAEVLRRALSLGKGAALEAGWQTANARGFEWVLMMDGDGQHAVTDVPKFLAAAEQTGAGLMVGNRMGNAKRMPRVRRWVNRWMSRRISTLAGMTLPDSQCGFRLMNLEAWSGMRITAAHFEIESEMLLAFARAGHGIEFVPIEVIYRDEESKIHPLRDTVRWIKWWRKAQLTNSTAHVRTVDSDIPIEERAHGLEPVLTPLDH